MDVLPTPDVSEDCGEEQSDFNGSGDGDRAARCVRVLYFPGWGIKTHDDSTLHCTPDAMLNTASAELTKPRVDEVVPKSGRGASFWEAQGREAWRNLKPVRPFWQKEIHTGK